jgi:hypothetical protein
MSLSLNVAFAADNDDKNKTATTEKAATKVVVATTTEKTETKPEGLYCHAEGPGGQGFTCWFCNCAGFAKFPNGSN